MRYRVRLRAGLVALATALLPAVVLAQATPEPVRGGRDFPWLWLVAAALVLVALFRMFFSRSRAGQSARRP